MNLPFAPEKEKTTKLEPRGRNGKDGGRCLEADLVKTSQEEDVFSSVSSSQLWTAVSILPSPLTVRQSTTKTQTKASCKFLVCSLFF